MKSSIILTLGLLCCLLMIQSCVCEFSVGYQTLSFDQNVTSHTAAPIPNGKKAILRLVNSGGTVTFMRVCRNGDCYKKQIYVSRSTITPTVEMIPDTSSDVFTLESDYYSSVELTVIMTLVDKQEVDLPSWSYNLPNIILTRTTLNEGHDYKMMVPRGMKVNSEFNTFQMKAGSKFDILTSVNTVLSHTCYGSLLESPWISALVAPLDKSETFTLKVSEGEISLQSCMLLNSTLSDLPSRYIGVGAKNSAETSRMSETNSTYSVIGIIIGLIISIFY